MPKTKTTLTKETREKMPPRGRNKRTLILEALKERAFKGLTNNSTPEQAERAWFDHLIDSAVDGDNKDASLCLRLITERGWAALKPVGEQVNFPFDKNGSLSDQAAQILDAVAKGDLAVDYGKQLVDAIKGLAEIIANTELKDRIKAIEEKLNIEG
jgi:hypothetical protein